MNYNFSNTKMTKKDWEEVDQQSRQLVKQFLTISKWSGVKDTTGNCCYDIYGETKNKRFAVEVKYRNYALSEFGDVFVELDKRTNVQKRIDKGEVDAGLAINVYNNGYMAISNLFSPDGKVIMKNCPITSMVKGGSTQYVKKQCLSLPQQYIYKIVENPDGTVGFQRDQFKEQLSKKNRN